MYESVHHSNELDALYHGLALNSGAERSAHNTFYIGPLSHMQALGAWKVTCFVQGYL